MREKLYSVMKRIYGVLMFISFFAGFLPLIPFVIAIIVGGDFGAKMSNFLYKDYYPYVILVGSFAIIFGLIAMYIGKLQGLSIKKVSTDDKNAEGTEQDTEKEEKEN